MERNRNRHQFALGLAPCLLGLAIALVVTLGLHALIPGADQGGAGMSRTTQDSPAASKDRTSAGEKNGGAATQRAVPRSGEVLGSDGSTTVTKRASDQGLEVEARALLGRYRDEGYCVLVRSGYLDLFGRVWSCTVQGAGWVDTCVVSEDEAAQGCEVTTIRMDSEGWASAAEAAGLREVVTGER